MKSRIVAIRFPWHLDSYFHRLADRSGLPFSTVIRIVLEQERKRMGKKVRVILKRGR